MSPPSHPWYYRDNAPLPVAAIPPADPALYDDLPRTREKRAAELAEARAALAHDIERYQDLVTNGEAALSEFDRMYGYLPTSLALKHNHISYRQGLILALTEALGPEQGTLF
jgi:hypothetical protein